MLIHILSKRTYRSHCFTYPLRAFRQQLQRRGIETRLFYQHDHRALTRCDLLAVTSDYFGIQQLIQRPDEVVGLLKQLRERVGSLIWCDLADDTGHLFEPAFAVVDLYAKKQVLKYRDLYRHVFYERSYHLNYYYEMFGPELDKLGNKARITTQRPLESWEIDKLKLAWNIGLGDYNRFWGLVRHRLYWPIARYAPAVADATTGLKPVHATCRVQTEYMFAAVTFHRRELRRRLGKLAREGKYDIRWQGKLRYARYLQEMSQSLITVSPFGWGEICWRDFEALLCGTLLLKPDMGHLETWPNYFEKDVTYASFSWDFSDFPEKLTQLLESPELCRRVAKASQDRHLASTSRAGGEAFADHLSELVREAKERYKPSHQG
jgi:hypothetical protein